MQFNLLIKDISNLQVCDDFMRFVFELNSFRYVNSW